RRRPRPFRRPDGWLSPRLSGRGRARRLAAERGWNGRRFDLALAASLLGAATCLTIGFAWLAVLIGTEQAFALGVAPFLIGAGAKAFLVAATLTGIDRLRRRGA
ncbi:MAG: biotin transporter BioY, partial [Alphaproteobacteria bacterium]